MIRLWQEFQRYRDKLRQKQQLLSMDERMRIDLAISRIDAERLAGRYASSTGDDRKWKDDRCKK